MNSKKLVISFGHIPREIGGKQHSGLSQVMWRLANEINKLNSHYLVTFVSTDVHSPKSRIQDTEVIGWNKRILFKYSLNNPIFLCKYFWLAIELKLKYKFPFINTLAKFIFWGSILANLKDNVALVHIHGVNNFAILNHIVSLANYKIVVSIHGITGNDDTQPRKDIQYELEKFMISSKNISSVVFVTEAIRQSFFRLYGKPDYASKVILNGYDPSIFTINDQLNDSNAVAKIHLVIIGGLTELKGQKRVLEALALLPASVRDNFVLTLIGVDKNNIMPEFNRFAKKNKIELEFLGYQSPTNIAQILQNKDYLILASSTEGFGLVCLESIACGIPVIIPEHLPLSQESGVLNNLNSVQIVDHTPKSIAGCLLMLNKSTDSKVKISKTIEHLTWPNIAENYIRFYDTVLANDAESLVDAFK